MTAGTTHRSQMRNNQEFSGCKTIKSAAATRVAATRCHLTIFGRIAFLRGGCISHGSAESRQRLDSGAESLLLSSSLLLVVFPFFWFRPNEKAQVSSGFCSWLLQSTRWIWSTPSSVALDALADCLRPPVNPGRSPRSAPCAFVDRCLGVLLTTATVVRSASMSRSTNGGPQTNGSTYTEPIDGRTDSIVRPITAITRWLRDFHKKQSSTTEPAAK